jgi:hypothetical protein
VKIPGAHAHNDALVDLVHDAGMRVLLNEDAVLTGYKDAYFLIYLHTLLISTLSKSLSVQVHTPLYLYCLLLFSYMNQSRPISDAMDISFVLR